MPRKYTTEQQLTSFWNSINKNGSMPEHCPELGQCWEWTGGCIPDGYGKKLWNGRIELTHRISWIIAYASIPNNLLVLHKCDNPLCARPDHLFLGTNHDNSVDREQKGRGNHPKGEGHKNAKLTYKQANEIRERFAQGGVTKRKLSYDYGVSDVVIGRIVKNKGYL